MTTNNNNIHIEGWEELAQVLGILHGGTSSDSVPSVELKNLAGGVIQKTVKVYNPDVFQASKDAQAVWEELSTRYG